MHLCVLSLNPKGTEAGDIQHKVIDLMHKICFTISLFHASTCFEHHVLIVRMSKLYYTASGIVTPIGGHPVHRLREDLIVKQILCIKLVNY